MIFIVVKHPVLPSLSDDWQELQREFTTKTRAEPGTISFEWARSVDDPDLYFLIEAFVDEEAGRRHVESAHFKDAIRRMPELLSASPEIVHANVPAHGWSVMAEIQVPTRSGD